MSGPRSPRATTSAGLAQITFAIGYQGPGSYSAQTVLTPGQWVAPDTTKNDPTKWPTASFTVSPGGPPQSLPHPGATVKAIEFKFTGPTTWHRGETIQFVNGGYLAHMIVAAKFRDAAAARKRMALLKAGKDGAAEKSAIGFVSFQETVSPGATQARHGDDGHDHRLIALSAVHVGGPCRETLGAEE